MGICSIYEDSTDAAKKTAEGVGVIGQSSTAIKNVVEKIADHDEAADKFAQSHLELTKEIGVEVKAIGQDVGEIKSAVTTRPKASGARLRHGRRFVVVLVKGPGGVSRRPRFFERARSSPILKAFEHLPERLQTVSKPIGELAKRLDDELPDGPSAGFGSYSKPKTALSGQYPTPLR
jgi:hypothetical protein